MALERSRTLGFIQDWETARDFGLRLLIMVSHMYPILDSCSTSGAESRHKLEASIATASRSGRCGTGATVDGVPTFICQATAVIWRSLTIHFEDWFVCKEVLRRDWVSIQ